jgi:hypothetical protein
MSFPEQRGSPVSEGIPRPMVACPPDLTLTEAQVFALQAARGIPAWGVEEGLLDFVLKEGAYPEKRAAVETWRIWAARHVRDLWDSPRRPHQPHQPQEPAGTLSEAQAKAQRAARRRETLEYLKRTEAEAARSDRERCPAPIEVSQLLARWGVRAKVASAAHRIAQDCGTPPTTQVRAGEIENAPAGRLGPAARGAR